MPPADLSDKIFDGNLNIGVAGLHGLVNNAGISGYVTVDDWLVAEDYQAVWEVNTLGVVRAMHAFKPFLKREKGRIVTATSVCGRVALPGIGPYSPSKFAVEAYMDVLRRELRAYGVSNLAQLCEGASPDTHLVTETYFHALMSKFPRKRYQIGKDCVFFYIPLSILSTSVQDWALHLMGLLIGAPKPAVLCKH